MKTHPGFRSSLLSLYVAGIVVGVFVRISKVVASNLRSSLVWSYLGHARLLNFGGNHDRAKTARWRPPEHGTLHC